MTSPKCKRPALYGTTHRMAAFTATAHKTACGAVRSGLSSGSQMCRVPWAAMHRTGVASARTVDTCVLCACWLCTRLPCVLTRVCMQVCGMCCCVACGCGVCVCVHFVCVCISMCEHVWLFRDVSQTQGFQSESPWEQSLRQGPCACGCLVTWGWEQDFPSPLVSEKDKFAWERDHLFLNTLVKFAYKNFWAAFQEELDYHFNIWY